jgi:hypothetical protein
VWGIASVKNTLYVLVWDDTGTPEWLLSGLFEIGAQPVPAHWEFALGLPSGRFEEEWQALWGYPRLVRDPAHREGLVEGEPEELDFFFTQIAEDALSTGLWDYLLSRDTSEALQLSELLEGLGTQVDRAAGDSTLIRPAAKVIELLVERGDLLVGDLEIREDGSLAVKPWDLSPSDIYHRIQRDWSELEEPKHVNAICWLEMNSS